MYAQPGFLYLDYSISRTEAIMQIDYVVHAVSLLSLQIII